MSAKDALKLAEKANLDLVKIAPAAKPPVCKIMDYGKYRFEAQKREKEARKKQQVVEIHARKVLVVDDPAIEISVFAVENDYAAALGVVGERVGVW